MKVFPLYEGSFSVNSSKQFIPFDPIIHKASDRPASLFIYVQPFLVQTDNDLILLDTGLGMRSSNGELQIYNNIRNLGFQPEDVTKVILSHLHHDHIGGMMRKDNNEWLLNFPKAEYFVQRKELKHILTTVKNPNTIEMLNALWGSPNLVILDGDGYIGNEISFEITGGHCEFHQVIWVNADGQTIFFGGDVVPEPEHLQRQFIAKYDIDGRKCMELRKYYGKEAVAGNWICLFYHATNKAVGIVKEINNSIEIEEYSNPI